MNIPDNLKLVYNHHTGIIRAAYEVTLDYNARNHGICMWWYRDGKPWQESFYVDGKKQGRERTWNESGILFRNRYYSNGIDVTDIIYSSIANLSNDITEHEKTRIALELGIII